MLCVAPNPNECGATPRILLSTTRYLTVVRRLKPAKQSKANERVFLEVSERQLRRRLLFFFFNGRAMGVYSKIFFSRASNLEVSQVSFAC